MYPSPEPGSVEPDASPYAPIRGGWLALAVAAPVLLSSLWIGLASLPIPLDAVASRNATELGDRLDGAERVAVALLGNSVAQRAIQHQKLSRLLGVRDVLANATLPGSTPTTWYAVLSHWIYGKGHVPKVVLVVAPSHAFWVGQSRPGVDTRASLQIAGTSDPTIEAHRSADWMGLDVLRQVWRLWVRQAALQAAGGAGTANLDESLELFVMGVEQTNALAAPPVELADGLSSSLDDTLLPELVASVQEHGGTVLFAVVPLRDDPYGDAPARDEALAGWAEAQGAALLELPGISLSAEHYVDNQHLTRRGSALYTRALARATRQHLDLSPRRRRHRRQR